MGKEVTKRFVCREPGYPSTGRIVFSTNANFRLEKEESSDAVKGGHMFYAIFLVGAPSEEDIVLVEHGFGNPERLIFVGRKEAGVDPHRFLENHLDGWVKAREAIRRLGHNDNLIALQHSRESTVRLLADKIFTEIATLWIMVGLDAQELGGRYKKMSDRNANRSAV